MTGRARRVAGLTAVLGLMLPCPALPAAAPAWAAVPLPGGRQALLSLLDLSPQVPAALLVGEVIRVVHASRETGVPLRAAVREHLTGAAAGAAGAEEVPLPLSLPAWRELLGSQVSSETLVASILDDRRASMLCYGLLQVDAGTLDALAADPALLKRIYERHSGVFAAFGDVVAIRGDRLELPGGEAAQPVWAALVGEPLVPAPRAVTALLSANGGRLAYFASAVSALDAAGLGLVFPPNARLVTSIAVARGIYGAFARIEPGWALDQVPFVRLSADPALLLSLFRADAATGRLRHSRVFWEVVLADDALPARYPRRWEDLDGGGRAQPGWLLEQLTNAVVSVRTGRLFLYHFVERLTDRLPSASAADLAWLARGYRRYPALLLTLERLDITELDVFQRLVRHATRLGALPGDAAQLEGRLALFQAPLMLVLRARQVRAVDASRAAALIDAWSRVAPTGVGYGRAAAAWFDDVFLPALGHDPTAEGASAEATVLEAMAGLRAPAAPVTVTWESQPYRVDWAAPDLARLTEIRARQGGNTLDLALALCRTGATLDRGAGLDAVRGAAARLQQLESALAPLEPGERTTAPAPPDVRAILGQAGRDLQRLRDPGDLRRLAPIARRLGAAEDAALADVLMSILYAVWLGDPQGQVFLAGNVARRHDFGLHLSSGVERQQTAWRIPAETSGDGEPWHMRGAVLGLDVGLARLGLHRIRLDLPHREPTLNESDRRTLMTTMALTQPADLDQTAASSLAGWIRTGRALLSEPARLRPLLTPLGLDGRRRQATAWALAHQPQTLAAMFLRTELAALGAAGHPLPDAWGAADTPRTGCLCLRFPIPAALQLYSGRPAAGLLPSRVSDLKLSVLEALEARRLPSSLARGVLAGALQDYLDDVRPQHGDDWLTLAHDLDRISDDRFDDYIAALAAGGPLVPLASETSGSGQR